MKDSDSLFLGLLNVNIKLEMKSKISDQDQDPCFTLVSKAVFLLTIFNKIALNLFALSTSDGHELVRTLPEDFH